MPTLPQPPDPPARTLDQVGAAIDRLTFGAGRSDTPARRPGTPAFHVIQACVDGSKESERALDWARDLAKAHRARVVVASVFSPPRADAVLAGTYGLYPGLSEAHGEVQDRLREAADGGAALLREGGVDAESVVTMGSPAHELAEVARTHHADLVVLGARGHGPVGRLLGSTADALLDRVHASVLLARGPPRPPRILAAVDGSAASRRAVAFALRQAEATGAEVLVQHVLEYPGDAKDAPTGGFLRDVIGRMRLDPPPRVAYQLDAGRPAERILARSRERDAGLVVVGSRGLGRVKGRLLGSVSRRVAGASAASVLVVKDPHAEA